MPDNAAMARRGRRFAWAVAALALAAVGGAFVVSYDALVEWWQGIPVVRTWGDLLAQRPIDLGDGVTVRLGIEAKRGPRWSGVLVYCLAEGCKQKNSLNPTLLPLRLSLREQGSPQPLPYWDEHLRVPGYRRALRGGVPPPEQENSPVLFVRAIPFPFVGKLELRVLSIEGAQLRCSTLEGTAETFHPWMPLEWPESSRAPKSNWSASRRIDGTPAPRMPGIATNRHDGIALPVFRGDASPASETAAGLAQPHRLLPSCLPSSEEPEIELEMNPSASTLTLISQRELVFHAEGRFLARWWVNGQAYVPEPRGHAQIQRREIESSSWGKRGTLAFDFQPDRLGAKAGDRIGLQLLYAPQGWVDVPLHPVEETLSFPGSDDDPPPILTNRIEFTAP